MPIRNPFAKRSDLSNGFHNDENANPNATAGFERVDTTASKTSSAMSINSRNIEPMEYKLSVVNDSGVYLPPSPPEKKSFWAARRNPSTVSASTTHSSIGEIEPFSISRESFDSYRRSFDISAKSPIIGADNLTGRQSLDSARLPRLPRSAMNERRFERQPPTAEEGFEEVGLNDEQKQKEPPKKKSFFSKFGESEDGTSRFNVMGRKRGQSGQGAELGSMESTAITATQEIQEVR